MLFIGPEAEQRFGRRHFMDMTAVFIAPPQFTVLHGSVEPSGPSHRPGGAREAAVAPPCADATEMAG